MSALFDPLAAKVEYERLFRWRDAWNRLANDRVRMRRLGALQRTQDKVEERAARCNRRIAVLMREFDVVCNTTEAVVVAEPKPLAKMSLVELRTYYGDATRDQLLLAIQTREQALDRRTL